MYDPHIEIARRADALVAEALERHSAALMAYARRLTRDWPDADDLVQETMLRCWSARNRFEPGTNFMAWSRTIMRNSFLSDRRRDRFQGSLPEDAFDRLPGIDGGQDQAIAWSEVERALAELSPEHRDAVLLAGQGVSIEDGAGRLAIPEGTFKSRVARARVRLRQLAEHPRSKPSSTVRIRKDKPRKRREWAGVMIG